MCFRASEARRHDGILDDPVAIQLVDTIDRDLTPWKQSTRQDLALRALAYDNATRQYLSAHPEATVVALGEGLQTSFWRLDSAGVGHEFRWLSVDLPPIIALREQLLPYSPRISLSAQSALDYTWLDQVDPEKGVFITAEGLLPYLQPEEAIALMGECARRFPGGQMMFDLPAKIYATLTNHNIRTTPGGGWPPLPFSLSRRELAELPRVVPRVRAVHDLPLPRGRGRLFGEVLQTAQWPPLYNALRWAIGIKWPTIAKLALLEFDGTVS
ncbi:class I SAM-dependent methyltransferase [Mycolicibacterium aichiense]|uniref:class I SAM-dependent methyltransferase n=1 Tax=Mycolicibacterium aichiense TaxID=1799 RepID=UPI003D66B8CC